MKAFLDKIGDELVLLSKEDLQNTLVLLPNRRAKLYLNKYIAQKISTPIWGPEITAINDFVFNILKLQECSIMELVIKLFEVHKKLNPKDAQSLDQFSSWAELLLSDFNEIDLYLTPVDRLFRYLSDAKKIAQWDLEPNQLTDQEKGYIRFYENLESYYRQFQKHMLSQNKAYQGMAFRIMAEQLDEINFQYSQIFIVGFNALSPAEEKIINHLQTQHQAKVFWDIDPYYFQNSKHEAGNFLRKHLANKELKRVHYIEDYWQSTCKNINIYGVDGNVAQVKLAAQILQEQLINNKIKEEETALVLGNEDLMIPAINSMPEELSKFNLTMSYPLRLHSGYDLVNRLLNLYINYSGKTEDNQELKVYYKHFISFLQHPFIQQYFNAQASNPSKNLIRLIQEKNISQIVINNNFLTQFPDYENALSPLFKILKKASKEVLSVLDILIEVFDFLNRQIKSDKEEHFIEHFIEVFVKLKDSLKDVESIERLSTLKRWIQNAMNQSPIPFIGKPLEGLQIMGMLETRTLDFKNLVLVSVNEGMLPKTKAYQSFILFDIKKEFGLPLPTENDAVTAYHFYRLLQRAENISLIYNLGQGGLQSNEASRFIKQIELEIPQVNPKIQIKHQQVHFPFSAKEKAQGIQIKKSQEVLEKLKALATGKGFSPSSLNNYKKCSYYFYLQKIMKLRVEKEVEEDMAYNTQGNIIHNTLEDFYGPYLNESINIEVFEKAKPQIREIFNNKIEKDYQSLDTEHGKNLLTRKILEQFLEHFIEKESKYLREVGECKMIGLEEVLTKELQIDSSMGYLDVRFNGSADRVDEANSCIRIVDYKTGSLNPSELSIKEYRKQDQWDRMFTDEYDKAFQLMMYAWMYWEKKPQSHQLKTGITAFKKHAAYFPFSHYGEQHIDGKLIERFEADLKTLIEEMFDPKIAFSQRKNDRICENCDYKNICIRG